MKYINTQYILATARADDHNTMEFTDADLLDRQQ